MSLGKKILALFLVLGLAICTGSYFALRGVVAPTFQEFERDAAREALSRTLQAIEARLDALSIITIEYSAWDETVNFLQDHSDDYRNDHLTPGDWNSVDIDFLAAMDSDDELVYGWSQRPGVEQEFEVNEDLIRPLGKGHILLDHKNLDSEVRGLLRTRFGILLITSQPVTGTIRAGDIAGTFMLGESLDEQFVEQLGERVTASISVHELGNAALPGHVALAYSELVGNPADEMVIASADAINAMFLLKDLYDQPIAVLEVQKPRTISTIGAGLIRTTTLLLALGSMGFLLTALFFTRRIIVGPITDLTDKILHIRSTGDLQIAMDESRNDELGLLAGQFNELTVSLSRARDQLEGARDEALSSSKAKSEFLARMSHEIRTPMNGVLGMTELLQNTPLNDKQRRFAKTIYSSAESLLHIINDILDISKIEAGKIELDVAPFDLRHMVEECLDLLADAAHRKNLELVGSIPPDAHTNVEGDSLRLRQILINLISNAVKFTEKGEIIVRVIETGRLDCGIAYRFEIEDTGIGIEASNLDKVFEPFTQEDGTTTRRFGGTGLGLSICKQLIELMGGEIGVESTPGHGCKFWFTIPLLQDATDPALMQPELLGGKRVLVVDDNATNREALQNQLDDWGMHVETAESGPEALGFLTSSYREAPFDIVLLDMNMPGMDGLELAMAIRESDANDELPLIMLSSVSSGDFEEDRSIASIDAWLTKPVRQARLYDALISYLCRSEVFRRSDSRLSDGAQNDSASHCLKILLAEDNVVNQKVALGMLDQLGHETAVVADGHEAVAARQDGGFDLILMDCQMPGMDGFEACGEIRRWERELGKPRMKIVAVTANALTGDRERCLAAGMDDYLSKPFTVQSLGAALAANTSSHSVGKTADVLVVEDNAVNQQVTQAMLEASGHSCEVVADGEQALRYLDQGCFDLILMDCHMPVLDGYETTREIRRREEAAGNGARIPIIAVTADLMESNRDKCLDCGMDDYVTKPFSESQLQHVVSRWTKHPGQDATQTRTDDDGFSQLTATNAIASIDRMAIKEISQLDASPEKSVLREVVVSYCALSTKLLLQLRAAVADNDVAEIEVLAHSLKGSSGQMGAVLLSSLCEQILTGARENDLSDAATLCERAAVEHSAVIIALDKELQRFAA